MRFTVSMRQRPCVQCISLTNKMQKPLLAFLLASSILSLLSTAHPAKLRPIRHVLPGADSHQGLLVAVDPYASADRYKDKFGSIPPTRLELPP